MDAVKIYFYCWHDLQPPRSTESKSHLKVDITTALTEYLIFEI